MAGARGVKGGWGEGAQRESGGKTLRALEQLGRGQDKRGKEGRSRPRDVMLCGWDGARGTGTGGRARARDRDTPHVCCLTSVERSQAGGSQK